MMRTRGGQRKHWAEKARVWCWYGDIQRRCGWSDYVLNYEFAWREEEIGSRSNESRPRIFEWIRKKARKPKGLDKRWRNMTELVAAVDEDPKFNGTRELYESVIWDMFQETTQTPEVIQQRLTHLLHENRLVQVDPSIISAPEKDLLQKYGETGLFDRCLELTLRYLDAHIGIALLWSLYALSEPTHCWPIRERIEAIADRLINLFFLNYFTEYGKAMTYYGFAVVALQQTKLDLSARPLTGYGYLQDRAHWPVLPKEFVGNITEDDLSLLQVIY